ncbi:hypothetical protein AGRA3207_006148 [Actinomadura graeca]|uniref:Secreted protein n=1 Tax=Actinomadura graeca TaxID=2750812 RepID=A0ABX8R465_9ACTN|nr:hypothetical protein [Actinomadura graeca]QXJ24757.1 hypothetical protein AGRA3207_006148 [Actinomadura graeca]
MATWTTIDRPRRHANGGGAPGRRKTTFTVRSAALTLLVAAPLVAAAPATTATPATASVKDCDSWTWPHPNTTHLRTVRQVAVPGGGAVKLEEGKSNANGKKVVWGHFPPNRAGKGKYLWMDVSFDHGRTWLQCGPFRTSNGDDKATKFHFTSPDPAWRMRACGSNVGIEQFACTTWY